MTEDWTVRVKQKDEFRRYFSDVVWFLPRPLQLWLARRYGKQMSINGAMAYHLGNAIYFENRHD